MTDYDKALDFIKHFESSDGKNLSRETASGKNTVGSYHVAYANLPPKYAEMFDSKKDYENAIVSPLNGSYVQTPAQHELEREIAGEYLKHMAKTVKGLSSLSVDERNGILSTLYNTGQTKAPGMIQAIKSYSKLVESGIAEQDVLATARDGIFAQFDATRSAGSFMRGVMKRTWASSQIFQGKTIQEMSGGLVDIEQMSDSEGKQFAEDNIFINSRRMKANYVDAGFSYDNSGAVDFYISRADRRRTNAQSLAQDITAQGGSVYVEETTGEVSEAYLDPETGETYASL